MEQTKNILGNLGVGVRSNGPGSSGTQGKPPKSSFGLQYTDYDLVGMHDGKLDEDDDPPTDTPTTIVPEGSDPDEWSNPFVHPNIGSDSPKENNSGTIFDSAAKKAEEKSTFKVSGVPIQIFPDGKVKENTGNRNQPIVRITITIKFMCSPDAQGECGEYIPPMSTAVPPTNRGIWLPSN